MRVPDCSTSCVRARSSIRGWTCANPADSSAPTTSTMALEQSAERRDRMVVARLCSLTVIAFDDSCAAGTVEAKLPETTLEPAQSGLDGALFGQNHRTRHLDSRMSPQTHQNGRAA